MSSSKMKKVTAGGLLVAMGVVYGDIGTSPLYVMKALVEDNGGLRTLTPDFILGSVSLVFWTLTLLTTIKYVLIALNADNHGEGGIFSLYTLVRKNSRYLIIPAIIGGAALLADGVLTPAVTVTTAIEGLRGIPVFFDRFGNDQSIIVGITLAILLVLFALQRFGTEFVGKAFGPIMLGWFTFLGIVGVMNFAGDLSVIRALDPRYAINLLFSPDNSAGLFILGNIFLATTGAEALYSDLGHVGKKNIYASWPYIKICLMLNYFGQAAWLLQVYQNPTYQEIENLNPFFQALPQGWTVFGVSFATLAAIIASQALLSGSFTLVSEAIKLKLLPRMQIIYPGASMDRLFWRGLVLPDLYSDGSCLWIGHYGNDVDDHYFAVFLLASKQEDPFLGTVHHALFCSDRGDFLYLQCDQIFPWRLRCHLVSQRDHRRDADLGMGQSYSRKCCRRSCTFYLHPSIETVAGR